MTDQTVTDKVKTTLTDQWSVDPTKVAPDMLLVDLGLDSLDRIEVIMQLEEDYIVTISDEAVDRIKTFGDLIKQTEIAVEARNALGS